MTDRLARLTAYLDEHQERHLARLRALLRQPSVSVDGEGIEDCARLLAELCRDAGFPEVELISTPGYPGVWAAYDVGAPITLAVYGMFDVRSADPRGWRAHPFGAEIVEMPPFPRVVMARGARAVKGPLGVWLNAVEACRATWGGPPVNLMLVAEGDEILGSPHYRVMIDRYHDRLRRANACWTPGASQEADGTPHLTLGYKGMIYMTLRASGARWGRGPKDRPIHGMAKAVVDSPAWRLVHALATLTGPDGNTVLIDGFDRDAQPATADEAEEMQAIMTRYSGVPWQRVLPGVQGADVRAIGDPDEADIYRRLLFGPSVNLNGLRSGFLGPGTATFTIPHLAEAVLDIRVPRTWDVREVLRAIRTRLDGAGFADVEMDVHGAFNGSRVSKHAPVVREAAALFAAHGCHDVVWWPATGGGGPWSIFAEEFGIPVLRDVGLGHGRGSATDEYLVIDGGGRVGGIGDMAASHAEFMLRLADPGIWGTGRG
jgi:acetylornithine deacetylase/succinyl-diaminopimelate desuccinylase-like protein